MFQRVVTNGGLTMVGARSIETAEIEDLLNLDDLQVVQDTFADIARVASLITSPDGKPITRPSNVDSFRDSARSARIVVNGRDLAEWHIACLPDGERHDAARLDWICAAMGKVADLLAQQALRRLQLQLALDARHEAEIERDRMEEHLRQSAKLEALGRLAGGVAHDFNNLLTAIHGYSELLRFEVEGRPEAEEILEHLFGVTHRAADMVRGLLDFARKDHHRSEPVDVNAVVRDTTALVQRSLDPLIVIEHDLDPDEPVVIGDHTQIANAILNLCLNARDAMPNGGRLAVATRQRHLSAAECRLHPNIGQPGRFVELRISDDGVGMSPETRERLFEPFFTTKQRGQGTGLGLAGVYSCVKAHRGGIDVASELGRGATITLYLPLAVGGIVCAEPMPAVVEIPQPCPAPRGRILVVDDEAPVRVLVQKLLTRAGHQVVTCEDGVEALEVWRAQDRQFDLVVLDLVMPRLGGDAVLASMMAEDPRTRVLIVSGFSAGAHREPRVAALAAGFLAKPFRPAELLAEADRILAAAPVS